MKIKRNLKYADWSYDFNQHYLKLETFDKSPERKLAQSIKLNRTYMFSIARFIVSVAQRIRIEEAKKFREQINKQKDQYLGRIGMLKLRLMKFRPVKKSPEVNPTEPLFEPKKSGQSE